MKLNLICDKINRSLTFNWMDGTFLDKEIKNFLLRSPSPYLHEEDFMRNAASAGHNFPRAISSQLYDFKNYGNQGGYLLIRNLKTDLSLIPTPEDQIQILTKTSFYSESWLAIFSCFY